MDRALYDLLDATKESTQILVEIRDALSSIDMTLERIEDKIGDGIHPVRDMLETIVDRLPAP